MSFFERLMGFPERNREQVHQNIQVDGRYLQSLVNGKRYVHGSLSLPTLDELRLSVADDRSLVRGKSTLEEVVGDVSQLHCAPENEHALFQVASQFNLLEMVGPSVTPEEGVSIYAYDKTQGPACAIAAAAGTIFRNYFVDLKSEKGQTADRQIDCLAEIAKVFGPRLWQMQNGYVITTSEALQQITQSIEQMDETQRYAAMGRLRIGIQWHTQVTLRAELPVPLLVSQAYCSALPVSYSSQSASEWQAFAKFILDAAYEATFAAALQNKQQTGNNKLFLTLLGGGAFGNTNDWIFSAIRRAFRLYEHSGLRVALVSYRRSDPRLAQFIADLDESHHR